MADDTPLIPAEGRKKQGHRVLCCCDSRKATIMVSFVALALSILGLVSVSMNNPDPIIISSYAISILFYLLVICGAIRYHTCACLVSMVWVLFSLGVNIYFAAVTNWDAYTQDEKNANILVVSVILAWQVFVIYALGTFIHEVNKGIMSPETHSREKYSCCCNV